MPRVNVARLRQSMGKDLDEFAKAVGVDSRTVRRWEAAETDPSPMAVRRLNELQMELEGRETASNSPPRRKEPLAESFLSESPRGVVPSRRMA